MKKIILAISVFSILFSCTDDLNIKDRDKLFNDENRLYTNIEGYKQGMAGVYANLALTGPSGPESSNLEGVNAGFSQYMRVWWYFQNMTTDETIWSYELDPGTGPINRTSWDANNQFFLGFYSRAMLQVALCNEFLRQSTESKLNERNIATSDRALILKFRAEARALRAMAYYHLIDTFGQAVFLTDAQVVGENGPRYNRQQLFTFVESELLNVMSELHAPNTAPYGRVDQGFARMVLAKLYLNAQVYIGQNKNTECISILEPLMSAYSLAPNWRHNFMANNEETQEMIFSVPQDGKRIQSYSAITVILNGQVGATEANGVSFGMSAGGWGGALRVRRQFAEKFSSAEYLNDTRNRLIIGSRNINITDISDKSQGYIHDKFSNISSTGIVGQDPRFPDTDFPMFRLADAYLMYAEAQIRRDGTANSTSLSYINALRTRANNPINNLTATQVNLEFILDERSRELYWEGHRRQDLIRFNKFTSGYNWQWKGGVQSGTNLPTHYNLFPLHPNSIIGSKNVLQQNPGY
jgi:hypothetical protein